MTSFFIFYFLKTPNGKAAEFSWYEDVILDACCQNIASSNEIWNPVVEHLLQDYAKEINKQNTLGVNGELLKKLWSLAGHQLHHVYLRESLLDWLLSSVGIISINLKNFSLSYWMIWNLHLGMGRLVVKLFVQDLIWKYKNKRKAIRQIRSSTWSWPSRSSQMWALSYMHWNELEISEERKVGVPCDLL